jgi:DNA-binding FadR family transcriptional regulator
MRDHFNDVEIFIKEDVKFHITISEAAGNKILYHAVSAVRDLLTNVQRAIVEISGLRNRSLKYHMQILEYIRANNAEKAAEVMDKHIADVEKAVKECINSKAFMFYVDSQN